MEAQGISFVKLMGLATFLEQKTDLDQNLGQLAAMAANILNSENCSIMLFKEDDSNDPIMKIFASHGYLPPVAFTEIARHKEGIAGHVAATGEAVLVSNIEKSPYASKARWPDRNNKGFLSAPIFIGQKVLGVINVNTPKDHRIYNEKDLYLLSSTALVVGKSIQVVQLQNILKSRFTQQALIQEARATVGNSISETARNPSKMARTIGKAFYREMNNIGFNDEAIIQAATEVISMLGENVKRHSRRLQDKI
ncbi:GAF domain-containing protein [Malonomonas rubra DSM 5091]|uniref:GAF domain-containing protein n=1 Tax=Malonomonas rubra DSM 5091 TaxID=1122189 RepID=A0A1M6BRD8_MALRU|nr:GAF domain-containing protein [Malonomonas rubra]SHI51292.1 GAF domain-containing protein [Malonomonas rubra DSM 5091]